MWVHATLGKHSKIALAGALGWDKGTRTARQTCRRCEVSRDMRPQLDQVRLALGFLRLSIRVPGLSLLQEGHKPAADAMSQARVAGLLAKQLQQLPSQGLFDVACVIANLYVGAVGVCQNDLGRALYAVLVKNDILCRLPQSDVMAMPQRATQTIRCHGTAGALRLVSRSHDLALALCRLGHKLVQCHPLILVPDDGEAAGLRSEAAAAPAGINSHAPLG